jgi:GTP-binding protein EngB required for normal cell division
MEWASEAIPGPLRDELQATITRCDERLALGVDHTIVALAGGTGSGKSTLFNAIAGRDFSVPGVSRPTTSYVTAATWGGAAEEYLDWLGVRSDRRMVREMGDAGDGDLAGLVLLDLPDHDSVNAANRDLVDHVLPMADLLMWVVDPQKYADHALHSAYLQVASDHGQPSLVVLNQVDRLATADAWEIVKDLQRLMAEDGLIDVAVIPVSARTGEGLDALHEELVSAARARTLAAEAVRADLVATGRALAGALSKDADPQLPEVDEMVEALARAVGVDARADAAAAVAAGRSLGVPALGSVTVAEVERERLDWVDAATDQLPPTWRTVVNEAVASADAMADEINAALAQIHWPEIDAGEGWKARFGAKARAAAAHRMVLAVGREVVRRAVVPGIVEPTQRIHEAYRVLDELTELD